jgi:hypothetical protein
LHWRAPWFESDVAGAIERIEIEGLGRTLQRSAAAALVLVHGSLSFGTRVELPPSARWEAPLWQQSLHMRARRFAFALDRRVSRYSMRAVWSAAVLLRLHSQFEMSVQRRGEEIVGLLLGRASRLQLAISIPLASPHGGGVAAGLAWFP